MNEYEIQDALGDLVKAMLDKGVKTPEAEMTLKSGGKAHATLWCHHKASHFDGERLKCIHGDTLPDIIAHAHAYIATLPDPATEGERKYTRKLAEAIDIATEYALPEAAIAPVRAAILEVNAVLLPAP